MGLSLWPIGGAVVAPAEQEKLQLPQRELRGLAFATTEPFTLCFEGSSIHASRRPSRSRREEARQLGRGWCEQLCSLLLHLQTSMRTRHTRIRLCLAVSQRSTPCPPERTSRRRLCTLTRVLGRQGSHTSAPMPNRVPYTNPHVVFMHTASAQARGGPQSCVIVCVVGMGGCSSAPYSQRVR